VADRILVAQLAPTHAPNRASGEQVHRDRPVRADVRPWDSDQPGWQSGDHHDQAHGLVEDDCLQCGEAEYPDQQGQPELGPAQPDQAT